MGSRLRRGAVRPRWYGLARFWGALGCVWVSACADSSESSSLPDGSVAVRELRSTRAGVAASLQRCQESCAPLAAGEIVQQGTIETDGATVATLELGRGVVAVLAPRTRVEVGPDGVLGVKSGAVTLEAPSGGRGALLVGGARIEQDPERSLKIVASSDGEEALVTVHRGSALALTGDAPTPIDKGQSLRVALDSKAPLRTAYEPPRAAPELPIVAEARPVQRGLGRMTARLPGQSSVVEGVELASHTVDVVIRGGIATTTVEEVFHNETDRVLEGRLVFPVPPDANISGLALWVDGKRVEGEMVEKPKAATIFKNIVDDTVRPRDPALLEWTLGSELSLKIFPLPARGERKVAFSYEQAIDEVGGSARYVYPLSSGAERATEIGHFAFSVRVESPDAFDLSTPSFDGAVVNERGATWIGFSREQFAPTEDLEVGWKRPAAVGAVADVDGGAADAFLLRARVDVDPSVAAPPPVRGARVLVFDQSASQTPETLHGQAMLARSVLASLDDGEPFALLSCDSACRAYPEDGMTQATPEMVAQAVAWMNAREPSGSSDVAGSIQAALERAASGGQLVYVGDGVPSAGELSLPSMMTRLSQRSLAGIDVRIVGAGRTVDELVLTGLAEGLGATYERFDASAADPARAAEIALGLAQPVLRDVELRLPAGAAVVGRTPRALRLGEELRLAGFGRAIDGELVLRGTLGAQPFERRLPIEQRRQPGGVVGRAVARARIDELTRLGDPAFDPEIVSISKRFFVMSRKTSLLVLENDRMFAEFGIERTRGEGSGATSESAAGHDGDDATQLFGSPKSTSFGSMGFGLSGVGEGGGGRGEGVGLGGIGTIGKGAGTGTGEGFGSGMGRLGGSHRAKPPSIRMGGTSVSGALPPEVIQRIVRQQFGRFRLCYENALRIDPELAGTVTIRFSILSDGSVGGVTPSGSMPAALQGCVAAGFRNIAFPQPEGGIVTVSYPLRFSPDGGALPSGWSSRAAAPSATVQGGDDRWFDAKPASTTALFEAVQKEPEKRAVRVALVKGLIARGRFDEAKTEAGRLVELDPDSTLARELSAQASVAAGDVAGGLAALDSMVELSGSSVTAHRRAAIAFEVGGDPRRACAHWISAAELSPGLRGEAWRCRTRSLGERSRVETEMLAAGVVEARMREDVARYLDQAWAPTGPAYESLGVTLACAGSGGACPSFATIDSVGNVVSPLVPDTFARAFPITRGGVYRTVLVGGDASVPVKVTASVRGITRSVELKSGERRTALTTQVNM